MFPITAETRIPPIVNDTMKLVLRSPLHGLVSDSLLLITFAGRKTGKTYTFPVGYSQYGNEVHIFTHHAWWNLAAGSPVTLRLHGRDVRGVAEPIAADKQAVAAGLMAHLQKVPGDAPYYGVTFDDSHHPRAEEVALAAQTVVMVCVGLC
jgi:hypothetical protein